jgi:hypothetical protein
MSPAEIILKCYERNIRLFPDGDKLRYRGPEGAVTEADLSLFQEHKQELLRILGRNHTIVHSKVLGRPIFVSWDGNDPRIIYVDRVGYDLNEIQKLKTLKPSAAGIKAIHGLKETFQGRIEG